MVFVTVVQDAGESRLDVVCTTMPFPLDDQDRSKKLLPAWIFNAGGCGGTVTLTETGAERVVAPLLSAATAVRTYEPETALLQTAIHGLVETSPILLVPAKNWTFVTVPSRSVASAARERVAPAAYANEPLTGLVILTNGRNVAVEPLDCGARK